MPSQHPPAPAVGDLDDALRQPQTTSLRQRGIAVGQKTSGVWVPRQLALHPEVFVWSVSHAVTNVHRQYT
jgi:hypothetical protein